jgi:hypothetical protein
MLAVSSRRIKQQPASEKAHGRAASSRGRILLGPKEGPPHGLVFDLDYSGQETDRPHLGSQRLFEVAAGRLRRLRHPGRSRANQADPHIQVAKVFDVSIPYIQKALALSPLERVKMRGGYLVMTELPPAKAELERVVDRAGTEPVWQAICHHLDQLNEVEFVESDELQFENQL